MLAIDSTEWQVSALGLGVCFYPDRETENDTLEVIHTPPLHISEGKTEQRPSGGTKHELIDIC